MTAQRGTTKSLGRHASALAARLLGKRVSRRLPPGDLQSLDVAEKADRRALARRADDLGPVFMGSIRGEATVCIVGLARCRRFLQENEDVLRVETLDLTGLFPFGFIRALTGDAHLDYRRRLTRAVRTADSDGTAAEFESLAEAELQRHAAAVQHDGHRAETWSATLATITTSILVRVFFGAKAGSSFHSSLVEGFRDLGPYGLVWHPEHRQRVAFERLCREVLAQVDGLADGSGEMSPTCVTATIALQGELDDTMLGNLVYMVEMGRSDLHNLLRWISRYVASDPALCGAIASGAGETAVRPPEESLLLEVLRADQSERLERRVAADVEFEGFHIPAGTPVRLCMWESHHDPAVFTDPFTFRPERFAHDSPTNEQFAPFGLDHHQCPFGTLTMRIGTGFARALCRHRLTLLADGPPRRGADHWEPSRRLSIEIRP